MQKKHMLPPVSVTILAVFVLFITSWYGIRVYSAIANWQVLSEFGANPIYILGTGLFWAITGLWLFVVLCLGKPHAAASGSTVSTTFFLWYWFDRLMMQPSPAPNLVFSAVLSTLGLAVFIITLNIPASRSFFNKER